MEKAVEISRYTPADLPAITVIWNDVVEDGNAFPQEEKLQGAQAADFFKGQSFTGVAKCGGQVMGLYILHPNNIGRCGHIANASYAVAKTAQGKGVGRLLVQHSMRAAAKLGFRILQFNAVVATNKGAIHLYKKLGFTQLGIIPGGFKMPGGSYADICPFYIELI